MGSSAISEGIVYNLGSMQCIPRGEGRVFRVRESNVALFRTRDDQVFATQPTCPHRGGPLADGLLGGGKVLCPLHNFAFDLATGQPVENTCAKLRTYPVRINSAGEILLTIDE